MNQRISNLRLAVVSSPETNDHAVQCLVDGVDIVYQLDGLGLDPLDFFSSPIAISAGLPRDARIGRCTCGVVGCGDVSIRIAREGEHVTWRTPSREVRFDLSQYEREVAHAASDFTWETPERTAARLLRERVPAEELAARGLVLEWASGRVNPGRFTMSLRPIRGEYRQVLVEVPWTDDLDRLLMSALEGLRRHS